MAMRELHALLKATFGQQPSDDVASSENENPNERVAYASLLRGIELLQKDRPDHLGAIEAFETAFINASHAGDTRFKALVHKVIGLLLEIIKDPERARTAYKSAIRMLELAELPDEAARMLLRLAQFESQHHKQRAAIHALRAALELYRRIGHAAGESETLLQFGEIEINRGHRAEAHQRAREAEAFLPLIEDRTMRLAIESRVGRLLAA